MKTTNESTNEVQQVNQEQAQELQKLRNVLGSDWKDSKSKEIAIFIYVCNSFRSRKVTFPQLYAKAIELRYDSKFDLKKIEELAQGTQKNFVNRFAKFLGGTIASAQIKESEQAKFFNIEIQTGEVPTFEIPINPSKFLSPQVKDLEQAITLPRRKLRISREDILPEEVEVLQE